MGTLKRVSVVNSTSTITNSTMANNPTVNKPVDQLDVNDTVFHLWFQIVLATLFAVIVFKEVVELVLCPSKIYHFKQMEKLGQYAVILVIATIAIIEIIGGSVHNFYEWAQIIVSTVYSVSKC